MAKKIVLNIDLIYPVGSIYMSVNSTNPKNLFGGTWTQLKDRFLLGAGSSYSNGATGGSATHTLKEEEMPEHSHNFKAIPTTDTQSWSAPNQVFEYKYVAGTNYTFTTSAKGESKAHNNMPPYLVVYMWKRVS